MRFAMWDVHERQCCYCTQPIRYGDMQIDHIVPEAVINSRREWAKIRSSLGLPETFDGQGLENFLPACGPCNRFKGGTAFDGISSLLPLRRAKTAKRKIERRLRALEDEAQKAELDALIDLRRRFGSKPPTRKG